MGGVILLTGATGFLGTQVARRLLLRAWWDWPELADAVGGGGATPLADDGRRGRVLALAGDVRAPGLGPMPGS